MDGSNPREAIYSFVFKQIIKIKEGLKRVHFIGLAQQPHQTQVNPGIYIDRARTVDFVLDLWDWGEEWICWCHTRVCDLSPKLLSYKSSPKKVSSNICCSLETHGYIKETTTTINTWTKQKDRHKISVGMRLLFGPDVWWRNLIKTNILIINEQFQQRSLPHDTRLYLV